jgi:hypothetical protein
MEQIAEAMTAAGLPDGFHLAAAEIFRRSPRAPLTADVAVREVMMALTGDTTQDG